MLVALSRGQRRNEMNGTRIFVESVCTTHDWGTTVVGQLTSGSQVTVGQYLDLFDSSGELILSTKVLGLKLEGSTVETATDAKVSMKLDNVIDADVGIGFVLVGMSASSELYMHQNNNLAYAINY